MDLCKISQPLFIVDKARAIRNIQLMADKAARSGVILRPHVKTHQSANIASWMNQGDASKITVSSVAMAEYFISHGFKNITIAVPINIHQLSTVNILAQKAKLGVLVDSHESGMVLCEKIEYPVDIWIEIDIGYHRSGIPFDSREELVKLASIISKSPMLNLIGLLTHAGQSYHAKTPQEIINIYYLSRDNIIKAKTLLSSAGFSTDLQVSIGDTPSCSIMEQFDNTIDEIRPGNYVFYDLTQEQLGTCSYDEIACVVACSIISKRPERNEVVIYGGGIHLSKEFILDEQGNAIYGRVALLNEDLTGRTDVLPDIYVKSLSQEHGVISTPSKFVQNCQIGDTLLILPVHSCMTANLFSKYYTFDGEELDSFRL